MSQRENYIFALEILLELEAYFEEELKIAIEIDDELDSTNNVEHGRLLSWIEVNKQIIWYRESIEREYLDYIDFEEE
jgi:hypothetical protein